LACGTETVDDAPVIIGGMLAVHGGQNPVGAGLHRQMHERHQRGEVAVRRDQRVLDVARMAGRIAQACDAVDFGEPVQQPSERPGASVRAFTVIGVDVLPDQRDLAHAVVGEPLHVVDDLCDRPRHFRAARIGHDAERAELVAAFLHRDEGRDAARADRIRFRLRQEAELVLDRKFGLDRAAFALCPRQKLRQMMIALRAHHDVDGRRAADDLFALGLGDATGDRDPHLAAMARRLVLGDPQPAQFGVDLFGGLLPDVTGVEDDEIRLLGALGLDEALARQRVHHALRIVDVHLAAIGFDVQLARRLHGTLGTVGRAP
jgi:hypothetical protein